jgi:CheY-like chemotaxis protein
VACRLYRATDGRLCLEIRDTGMGISEEYLPRLFQPFSQEQSGPMRKFQGSGLGLALARKYLELNGAEISVQSEKGKGTTFTIRFSQESEAAADPSEPQSVDRPPAVASRPTILVVEDDAETQAYMRTILRREYEVVIVASDAEARNVLAARPDVSLILLDLALGEDDGLTLVRFLRGQERWKQVPIIAVTAHASSEYRERALKEGCDDYLAKPVNRRELLAKINAFVSRPPSA